MVSKPSWMTAARSVRAAGVVAVVDREQRTASGHGLRRARTRPGARGCGRGMPSERPRLTSATVRPSRRRRKTAPRSPSKSTIAWSTRPDRIRSRSSRLPMSPATRRSASARCSWRADLLAAARGRCDGADRVRDDRGDFDVVRRERRRAARRRHGGRPTAPSARGSRRPARLDRRARRRAARVALAAAGEIARPRPRPTTTSARAVPRTPKARGRSMRRSGAAAFDAGRDPRHDPVVPQFPDGDEVMAVGVADAIRGSRRDPSSRSSAAAARRVIASMRTRSCAWRSTTIGSASGTAGIVPRRCSRGRSMAGSPEGGPPRRPPGPFRTGHGRPSTRARPRPPRGTAAGRSADSGDRRAD